MTFLAPWAGWFLTAVPLIVLLYFFKLKRRALTVSTLIFWQRVLEENRHRTSLRKLRQLFSLLLHLLIFLLILGALAKPVRDRAIPAGTSTVLIIDTRARMKARESETGTRLDLARKMAGAYLDSAAAGQEVALLTAGAATTVVVPFTANAKLLHEELAHVTASDATGDLEAATELAGKMLGARKGAGRILVFSAPGNHTAVKERKAAAGLPMVEWVTVGSAHDNLAILQFATRPLLSSPQTSEVLLEVANFGSRPAQTDVVITLDGRLLEVQPLSMGPGQHQTRTFPITPALRAGARGWLEARLTRDDAQPGDNIAYALLPPVTPRRVLLVTKGNWFLEKMLAADQEVQFELLAPEAFRWPLADKFEAVILDDFLPAGLSLEHLRGNFFFLKQTPFSVGGEPLERPLISETAATHPTLRLVNLQNVTLLRASSLDELGAYGDWQLATTIRSFDHSLMIAGQRRLAEGNYQRLAALALDVTESDLPLRVAFPLLMANTLQWLAGDPPKVATGVLAGASLALEPGEIVTGRVADLSTRAEASVETAKGRGLFQPLVNGFYAANQAGKKRWLAVNTFSEAESDLRATGANPPLRPSPLEGISRLGGGPIWRMLALAALCLFTLEWGLFHRRRTE